MAPLPVPNLALLTGPLVLGYLWSYMFYGILIVQLYIYFLSFPKDNRYLKAYVWVMFIIETIFTVMTTIAAWNNFGPGFGDINTLIVIDWSWDPLPELNGFIACMAQSFYIWRIYMLTKNIWIPAALETISLAQLAFAFYYGIKVGIEGRTVTALFELTPFISTWLAGAAACDILITITLVLVLRNARQKSSHSATTLKVTRVIRFSVETGMITSFMAIAELILWLTSHQINVHFIGFLVLGKLYSNTLVATLNSRAPIFNDAVPVVNQSAFQSGGFWADQRSQFATSTLNGVHISKNTDVVRSNPDINSHPMAIIGRMEDGGSSNKDSYKYRNDF